MEHLWTVCLLLALLPDCRGVLVQVEVDRGGVRGMITFNQTEVGSEVTVTLGLEGLTAEDTIQLAIHTLPFPPSSPNPCQLVGPVFRDLGSVRLGSGNVSYSNISLFGVDSIVGRSLIIAINSTSICVGIRPPTDTMVMWAPFRSNNIANGNVFLWQQTIYINLTTSASSLSWALLSLASECATAPDNIYDADVVGRACSPGNWTVCAAGNLTVVGRAAETVISQPGLSGVALAVRAEGLGSQCASIKPLPPLRVVAGVREGRVVLIQQSPLDSTEVILPEGGGLRYEVHSGNCQATGGIFDPRGVGPAPQGSTRDFYPFGDLSGKARNFTMYFDPYLPLSGRESVVGRALVVKNSEGTDSGCGLLRYDDDIIQMRADLEMEGFSGAVVFSQPASNPFSETIITIETNISAEVEVFTSTPFPSSTPLITSLQATPLITSLQATSLTISSSFLTPSPTPSQTPESSPSLLLPYESSSIFPPTFLPTPAPFPSSSVFLMMPAASEVTPSSSVAVGEGRRRRRRETAVFSWSLRQGSGEVPENCGQLPLIGSAAGGGCSPSEPLSCATGDLSGKHGPLSAGPLSALFHDPYLPLSGPDRVTSAVLFLEPANGIGDSICVPVTMVTTTSATPTPTTLVSVSSLGLQSSSVSSTLPTSPPARNISGDVNIVLIGAIVGGVVGAALVLTVLLLCVCLCVRRLRSERVDLSKLDNKNGKDVEMGHYQLMKPQIGSDQYRVVYPYKPQNSTSGDLALEEGEWVTLVEAPPGGKWWRGQATAGEGWFPKSHVQFVDRDAERRKAEEENFRLAAAAIKAASNSFNERHLSLTRSKATPSSTRRRAATNLSKGDISSTPVPTAKLDISVLDSVVIENQRHLSASSASGGSRPHTPRSLGEGEPLANLPNHVSTENSQGSSGSSEPAPVNLEPYLAKFTYSGGTEIELPLRKGEVVSVLEKREGGWWQGVCGGRVGWFPASYVKPAPVREERKQVEEGEGDGMKGEGLPEMEESLKSDTVDATEYRAIHAFSSEQEGDLQFGEGEAVLLYWVHGNGWWYGSSGGRHGWFPRTFVELSVSEVGSPLPPLSPGAEVGEKEEEVTGVTRGSPLRRSWRKRLSFKKSRSQEEPAEGGLTPLLPQPEVKGEKNKTPTRPRRKAPPPPGMASPRPADQSIISQTTPPPSSQATPTPIEDAPHQQPVAKQHKQRKTSSALSKPRRLPPAPPTSLATPQTPPTKLAHPPNTEEAAPPALAPPSGGATPIAPPRRKMKRVKRPATRLIPPPPTIPLPPPPSHTSPASPRSQARDTLSQVAPQTAGETASESGPVSGGASVGEALPASREEQSAKTEAAATTSGSAGVREDEVLKSPLKKPPPLKPKPAHLSKRVSESRIASSRSSLSPPAQGSPKPPPPARTSSLHQPTPPQRREPKLSLTTIPDSSAREEVDGGREGPDSSAREEVDSGREGPDSSAREDSRREGPGVQETAEAVRNLRSAPPSHPPPPRPAAADQESPKHRSDPPSFPPPQRPPSDGESSLTRSSSLKARGSQLMRSLKKMVQKSESKEEGEESEQNSPARGQRSRPGEVIENQQTESPQPERKKSVGAGIPPRPPPPHLVRKSSGDRGKLTPARPPPPKLTSSSSLTHSKQPEAKKQQPGHTQNHTPSSLPTSAGTSPVHSAGSAASRSVSPQPPSSFYRALADYVAQSPSELSLHQGDVLVELDRPTPHMFFGMLDDGTTGLFPASAVESISTPSSQK